MRLAVAYLATGVTFILLDAAFLTLVGPRLYRPDAAALLADHVRLAPAILFYALYISGLVYFCVRQGLDFGWGAALVSGLALGLLAYGTYDLTCHAVMKAWSWKITLADMAWGAMASAAASTVGTLVTAKLVR